MSDIGHEFVRVGTLAELEARGRMVLRGHRHRPVLVICDQGRIRAFDNRCPHMGFPLDRGTVEDGILTCHWHHARFDLASGCTFDLWADDVPTCPVELRDAEIWVRPVFDRADPVRHWQRRLADGLAHELDLVIAKAVRGLLTAGAPPSAVLRQATLFGTSHRDGWGVGLTILTALGNVVPALLEEETCLALFHGARRVAADCAGQAPRRDRAALEGTVDPVTLQRWLRRWTAVRHRGGAERTLLTAVAGGAAPATLAELLLVAGTERIYADGGHVLDFVNKALECLDLIGWEHAAAVLPSLIGPMVAARGAEESTAWRLPVDLLALVESAMAELPMPAVEDHPRGLWRGHAALGRALLADDPAAVLAVLTRAAHDGAEAADLARALAYAAALRVARFAPSNEHGDWETAHHAFTHANAVHQALKRLPPAVGRRQEVLRAVFHGAMAVYLARYLNVPPARLPGEEGDEGLNDLPSRATALQAALLDSFDRRHQVELAARLVARHLRLGHPPELLITTLATAVLREDAGFHAYQMLEAGVRQFHEWGDTDGGRHVLIAVARYLAAHFPTERATHQTAETARQLLGGGQLHEGANAGP
jgi:nitrite reductase/ring-hydroxylating ferredoxin subunit